MTLLRFVRPVFCALLFCLMMAGVVLSQAPATKFTEGLRDRTPAIHALVNARIVVAPGQVIEKGTIVVRNGAIAAVGADVAAPADARVWDLAGKTVYPGLIDAFSEAAIDAPSVQAGAPHWNPLVSPQLDVARHYQADAGLNEKYRGQGIAVRLVAPAGGVIKGASALVTTGDEGGPRSILKGQVAQHILLTVPRNPRRDGYPNSPMGAVALARQTLYDAQWYRAAWNAYRADAKLPRPERNDALDALQDIAASDRLVIIDANNELFLLRADRFAREFSLNIAVRGSGREYRRLDAVAATGRTVIVPVNFPKPPNVSTAESAQQAALEDLLHWDFAPENPARLEKAGVKIALATHGLKEVNHFLPAVRRAVERGLPPDAALRAITTTPAALYGVGDRLGSVEKGKAANFVVTDGDLFAKKTKVLETWVDGVRYEVDRPPLFDLRGKWQMVLAGKGGVPKSLVIELTGEAANVKGEIRLPDEAQSKKKDEAKDEKKTEPKSDKQDEKKSEKKDEKKSSDDRSAKLAHIGLRDARFSCTFEGKAFGRPGHSHLSAIVSQNEKGELSWFGEITWADDSRSSVTAQHSPAVEKKKDDASTDADAGEKKKDDPPAEKQEKPDPAASFTVKYPFGAFGRSAVPEQAKLVLLQHATIWTSGPAGILEDASLLIGDGKILAVGKNVATPPGAVVVDCRGKFLSPGIIDCHSHMATDGGVNESGRAVTAMVRVGDFIDDNDISIYRQLAGGVTTAHILHGSANPIGGQCQAIKLRWGMLGEDLKFSEAPPTIKLALGENVKQSNWAERATNRYPQSRMGVDQLFRDEFQAAREYQEQRDRWQQDHEGPPPRRDLELDAISEILQRKRWIHCHSYRQDEILAFVRTMDAFGVRISTMQHILEGYKVADVLAKHGAAGSAFADWWGYKFEVLDAIPHAGALMHKAGVVMSFNSDDQELARHLNQEAAKAVKYGGVPPIEAFQFVTLNPAKQLFIDQYVGSLEPGKHADFVIWNAPPLSNFARPEQTWVDGRRMFDLPEDRQLRDEVRHVRTTLIQKILTSEVEMRAMGEDYGTEMDDLWPREDEFCHEHPHHAHK